jgi:sortase (surface protein transpeptidase)
MEQYNTKLNKYFTLLKLLKYASKEAQKQIDQAYKELRLSYNKLTQQQKTEVGPLIDKYSITEIKAPPLEVYNLMMDFRY